MLPDSDKKFNCQWLFLMAACLSAGFLMPSSESLWIDEAWTALNTFPSTFPDWLHRFQHDFSLDSFKPLTGFSTWLFSRAGGNSEYALRCQNLFWYCLGLGALGYLAHSYRRPVLLLLYALHPFVWHYMGEVRPYAMQLGAGCLLLTGCIVFFSSRFREQEKAGFGLFCTGAFLLAGSSLLGILPVAACCMVMGFRLFYPEDRRKAWIWIISAGVIVLLWMGYYLGLLLEGKAAARVWDVSFANYAFSLYEFLGFSGLGIPRETMRTIAREGGIHLLIQESLRYGLWLGLLAAAYIGVGVLAYRDRDRWRAHASILIPLGLILTGTCLFLGAAAWMFQWPFWGRHLTPVFPFALFLLAFALHPLDGQRKTVTTLLLCMLALSSFNLRYSSQYRSEDYKGAARAASDTLKNGGEVWWAASLEAAEYYQVDIENPDFIPQRKLSGMFEHENGTFPAPDLFLLNRPEINDPGRSITRWLTDRHFQIQTNEFRYFISARPAESETRSKRIRFAPQPQQGNPHRQGPSSPDPKTL